VAGGYRRPLPEYWPEELRSLISECWAQDPTARPSMDDVCARLKAMQVARLFDEKGAPGWKKTAKAYSRVSNNPAAAAAAAAAASAAGDESIPAGRTSDGGGGGCCSVM
jgi:hypothetical protein